MKPARISIDTRTLQPGDTYYALIGERCDGHDFVAQALERGASRAVVAARVAGRFPADLQPRLERVEDPLTALQQAARARRRTWGGPLLAITGSAGKTTTKDMLAAALATRYQVLKTEGNHNNHVGVPLTLLRLEETHEIAVVEMGMNHAGEIAHLAAVAEPNVGVFTNVGEAHIGNFDSIEGVAAAKRELAEAIPPSGALVLNADDARVARFGEGFAGRVVRYRADDFHASLLYPGRHHRANAAAAVAAAALFGVEADDAARALAALAPPAGRGAVRRHHGWTLMDDCYNANPAAMAGMLEVLRQTPGERHIAVLGEMRELGAHSDTLHRQVGAAVAAAEVDALFAVAGDAGLIIEGARAAGWRGEAQFLADTAAAAAALERWLRPGDVVLFKASRGVHLELVIQHLTRT